MKKILTFALLTLCLILNAGAGVVGQPPVTVPDAGSTAVLLGLGFAALAAVRQKINQG
jgi:hypothetical protein